MVLWKWRGELVLGKRGHTEQEILGVLREVESGDTVVEICRKHGISQQTFYLWKKKYAGLGLNELRKLRQLRDENAKLKRLVADLSLDRHVLQEVVAKKTARPRARRELAEWAQSVHGMSKRRVAQLIPVSGDAALPTPLRPAGGLTDTSERAGRQPCALWLPTADRAAQARRLGGQREADLPVVCGGGSDKLDTST